MVSSGLTVQIPILNGVYASPVGDVRASYPVNLVPVIIEGGVSKGYLRPADGIVQLATGPGIDRGGINWNGICYRVMGSKLVSVSSAGVVTSIGDVENGGPVAMDYSFDRLAIISNGGLYYYDGAALTKVTDPDLGTIIDMFWVDGYFMLTDGEFIIVTELNDPASINPLKYGSAEADPDPIRAIKKIKNEPSALGRYTIETYNNVGGELFPFARIEGAQIQKGVVGTNACCVISDALAFVGGGRDESISVYVGYNGVAKRIATREIDLVLTEFTEAELATSCVAESRVADGQTLLYIHLPDRTLVYDFAASDAAGLPVWYVLTSALFGLSQYRARFFVRAYDKWIVGDTQAARIGTLTDTIGTHWGAKTGWNFGTIMVYNESRGAVFHSLELVSLNAGITIGDPVLWTSYSTDGQAYSMEKPKAAGSFGDRHKRIAWLRCGLMSNWRIQRFRGTSDARISVVRLEALLEPLNV